MKWIDSTNQNNLIQLCDLSRDILFTQKFISIKASETIKIFNVPNDLSGQTKSHSTKTIMSTLKSSKKCNPGSFPTYTVQSAYTHINNPMKCKQQKILQNKDQVSMLFFAVRRAKWLTVLSFPQFIFIQDFLHGNCDKIPKTLKFLVVFSIFGTFWYF